MDQVRKAKAFIELNLFRDFNCYKKVSIGTSVTKGRPENSWALSGRKWETWSPGICRGLRYLIAILPQSSLTRVQDMCPWPQKAKAGIV